MAFDRSKYVGGSRKAQAKKTAVAEKFERRGGGGAGTWHYVEDGKNVFRIAPPHNPESATYEVYRTTTLECMKPVYKDGEDTGTKELGRKKIVSASVHHDKLAAMGPDGDPVELYVKMVKDIAFKSITDKDERRKFLAPINGFRGKDKKWVWGIEPRTSYLAYAWDKDGQLGKLELNKGWMGDIDRLAEELEEEGAPSDIDPFSNPVEGYPLIITKSKNDNGKTEYIIDKETPSRLKKETWEDFFKRTEISDEQLKDLDSKKPLEESYTNSYSISDFEAAMDGLARFDEKYGFGILDLQDFDDAVTNIKNILMEGKQSEPEAEPTPEPEKPKPAPAKKAPAKKAPVKKAVAKKGPSEAEMNEKVSGYIVAVYGEEYTPQIPAGAELVKWYETVKGEESEGDLPLVAVEDFQVEDATPDTTEETETGTTAEPDNDSLDEDATAKLREQMKALRAGRR